MEYVIITPIEKAAMAAAPSTGGQAIPWPLIIAALIALGILIALAVREYEKSKNQLVHDLVIPRQ